MGTTIAYQDLENLPERFIGELFDGRLHAQSRPAAPHVVAGSVLGAGLLGPFQIGNGGPGGGWIIDEPEIHFVLDIDVAVPDLAGWLQERVSKFQTSHKFEIVPDWICEILSPSTRSIDREIKMPLYAQHGVSFLWLVDPIQRVLEAYRLVDGKWQRIDRYMDTAQAAIPPFDAVPFDLDRLWMPTG